MKRQIISGLVIGLVLVSPSFGRSKSSEKDLATTEITIRIRDYAHANPLVLEHAESVAGELLHKADVETRWIDCPVGSSGTGVCSRPLSTLDFVVNLLPHTMSDQARFAGGVLGSAIEGTGDNFGFIASVFYDIAKEQAGEHQVDFGELLGDAVAHELGHLLLGTNSHSGRSLMSAFWSGSQFRLAAQGGLEFSSAEVKRIKASMNARTLAEFTPRGPSPATGNASE